MLLQELSELVGRSGFAEVIPLHLVTGVGSQEGILLLGFHALGDYGKTQGLPHGNNRLGDRPVLRVLHHVANEGSIHFNRIDRKAFDM